MSRQYQAMHCHFVDQSGWLLIEPKRPDVDAQPAWHGWLLLVI